MKLDRFFKSGGIFRTNINRAAGGSLVVREVSEIKFKRKKKKKSSGCKRYYYSEIEEGESEIHIMSQVKQMDVILYCTGGIHFVFACYYYIYYMRFVPH